MTSFLDLTDDDVKRLAFVLNPRDRTESRLIAVCRRYLQHGDEQTMCVLIAGLEELPGTRRYEIRRALNPYDGAYE